MQNFTRILGTLALLSFFSFLSAQSTVYEARLNGNQEALPVATRATGSLTATLTGNVLVVEGSYENLSAPLAVAIGGGAHLHIGYAGQNGGVTLLLTEDVDVDLNSGTYSAALNTFTLTDEQLTALQERRIYANIHSLAFTSGEIRGQLLPQADEYYFVNLLGSNEVPSVITGASGAMAIERNDLDFTVSGSFQNLEGTYAANINGGTHLHVGRAGRNGNIAFGLSPNVSMDSLSGVFAAADNTFSLSSQAELGAISNRQIYVNIHSQAFPSGELRGQITGMADAVFRAHLSGSNEWPVVTSRGHGQVLGELYGDSLVVSGSFNDLGSAVNTDIAGGAHLHLAPAGLNGPIMVPLGLTLSADGQTGSFDVAENQYILTSGQVDSILLRQVYVNIHTMEEGSGELRGQMLNEAQAVFTAYLTGDQQPTGVPTDGRGMVKLEWSGDNIIASGGYTDLSSAVDVTIVGGAHIHAGYPGQSGSVLFPLVSELDLDMTEGVFLPTQNQFDVSMGQVDTMRNRAFYVNIHTLENGGGEIRGSLLAEATSYFLAPLSGASEVNPVNTSATGAFAVELRDREATVVGSFEGLESDFNTEIAGGAHLHDGYAGRASGVDFLLNSEIGADNRSAVFQPDANVFMLTEGQFDTLMARSYYANIHSVDQPGGELRGQVLPLAGRYFHTSLLGINEVPPAMSPAMGGLKLELTGNELTVTGGFANLMGDFDASIGGGAHLHVAGPGMNGDVILPISATTAMDLRSGIFTAEENTYTLDADQRAALTGENLYANIHTMAVASGELRGQLLPEVNLFPEMTSIEFPADGAAITIEGDAAAEFTVTWLPATDPDGNEVVYIWQLAVDESFETLLIASNTGTETLFTATFGLVDLLLGGAGVEVGSEITLYHRVIASDGSNNTPGETRSVDLTRGVLVGTNDLRPTGFVAQVYPTLTRTLPVQVEITTEQAFAGQIVLVDELGRLLEQRQRNFVTGLNQETIEVDRLTAGTYLLFVQYANGIIHTERIVVQ